MQDFDKQTNEIRKLQKEANELQQQAEMERIKALNTEDSIYFNFSYTALKLLGKNLYSNPWTAISELVANGIDAKAKEVYVYIDATNKKHSTVEIIDNGIGMNYTDLADKYVWIGRNKREDDIFSKDEKSSVMGRKGIGKLAALYLSPQYNIISKKGKETIQWSLNVNKYRDSDFPKLDRIQNTVDLKTKAVFDKFTQGTALKLIDVNLQGMGEKTVDGIKRTLADFYLLDNVGTEIFFCFIEKANSGNAITFDRVSKKIAYKNFYAAYDNSQFKILSKMQDFLQFNSKIISIAEKERPTIALDIKKFKTSGKDTFYDDEGKPFDKEYKLEGWIGIHSTIVQSEAQKNDPLFIRRDGIYTPNQLRLYVRNKLAVANFLNIIESNQAMSNYIEGEISFDILDDDDLPDIATSNRQSFLEDKRVAILKDLINPILTKLFSERNAVGREVSAEEEKHYEKLRREEEERAKAAEEARKKEEEKAKAAEEAKKIAEEKQQKAEEERNEIAVHLAKREKQTYFLQNALNIDKRTLFYNTHVVKDNAGIINDNLKFFIEEHDDLKDNNELKQIAFATNKILITCLNFDKINYDFERKIETDNIGLFIEQYFNSVKTPSLRVSVKNKTKSIIEFPHQDVTLMLYNVVTNSLKAHANKLVVEIIEDKENITIQFVDDGDGIDKNIKDPNTLFDLGLSYTRGTGVGLAQIKELITNDMNGSVSLKRNEGRGVTLEVKITNENRLQNIGN